MKREKSYLLLLLILLLTVSVVQANLSIGSGTTFSLGSATLSLSGDWTNAGAFTAGSGTVIFNGAGGNQTITNASGETFNNVTVNKSVGDVLLANNITVNGTLTLTGGDVDLNGQVLTLGSSGSLSETAGNTVKGATGYITCSADLSAPAGVNPHGIGVSITSSANLGVTTIVRGHAAQTGSSHTGITRYFTITPANNSSLNASLVLYYDESELNSITESELTAFRSEDGGSTWSSLTGSSLNASSNTVSCSGLATLSRFTLASSASPLSGNGLVRVQAKIFLEGAYNTGTHQMDLAINGSIPTTAPYSQNARSVGSIPATITDWALVELRSTATGAAVDSKSAFLRQDGVIVADNGTTEYIEMTATPGNYFLVIRHRNHLAVMSDETLALSNNSSTLYNFTVDASTAYDKYYGGEAAVLETGVYGMYSGDSAASGTVAAADRGNTWTARNVTGYRGSDCDLSGAVDANDRTATWNNRNTSTNIQ